MPRRNQPLSLRETALTSIARNFDTICYGTEIVGPLAELINTDKYLGVEGPFAQLPSSLVEDISDETKQTVGRLRRHHLLALVLPQLESWSYRGVGDCYLGFQLLAHRCHEQKLRRLNVSYLRHMGPSTLLMLGPCFKNLVTLNLEMTMAVDQLLGEIGSRCEQLLDLNLSMTPITDKGIVQLCVASDGRRRCQKLMRLSVQETYITTEGAALALQSLPNLRDFDYERIFEALEDVSKWSRSLEMRLLCGAGVRLDAETAPPPQRLRLTTLTSSAETVSDASLDAATRLCVDAQSLALSNAWLDNESLYKLMLLENLTSLSLTNCDGLTLDFYEGVLPLLSVCGSRLESLILTNFAKIQISNIGKACPQLRNLALSKNLYYEFAGQPCSEYFTQLKALEVWADLDSYLNHTMLRQLLIFSTKLKNLLFTLCKDVTDDFLAQVWKVNPMSDLAHFTLDRCHSVSQEVLVRLLNADNQLTHLRVWNCDGINKQASLELAKRMLVENMDCTMDWFGGDNNYNY